VKIAAGDYKAVVIRYCPIDTSMVSVMDTIKSDADVASTVITLKGGSFARTRIVEGPAQIEFGSLAVGKCKDTVIKLTNTGNDNLTITASTLTGETSSFTLINAAFPMTIAPGASATFTIHFCPTAATSFLATDSLTSDATSGSTGILLHGTGTPFVLLAGSTFHFTGFRLDSSGTRIQGSDFLSIDTVAANEMSYAGKSNVARITHSD